MLNKNTRFYGNVNISITDWNWVGRWFKNDVVCSFKKSSLELAMNAA